MASNNKQPISPNLIYKHLSISLMSKCLYISNLINQTIKFPIVLYKIAIDATCPTMGGTTKECYWNRVNGLLDPTIQDTLKKTCPCTYLASFSQCCKLSLG